MTLQWTFVAAFLYLEVFALILLMLPFIKPYMWQRFFNSGIVKSITAYAYIYFNVFLFILVLLFLDSVREVSKYTDAKDELDVAIPNAEAILNMKLFRAQRNFYVAGFAFFLFIVLKRMCNLISKEATLIASNEASVKQAQGASDQAKRLMDEMDELQKELETKTKRRSRSGSMADIVVAAVADSEVAKDLKTTRDDLASSKAELEKSKKEMDAVKKQAEGVSAEYDRLLEEHSKLQKQVASSETKKDS
ncbi:B-cell receptor-associated protein 31 [Strongylocentrotus purpuratus]|uniref:Endoplasmic reticulum transmembrane protein n=1 Tax=Strongylocentrotus purpuratus TaxID=7668 RepID=A0A7M7MXM7_STRPU|nr:B-cell receptor-associated protein 31 [Strongylocentrotus purpuratus]